jgi:hypothetical protein
MIFLDALTDTALDCLKMLPFLFLAFLLLEALEHHTSEKMNRALLRAGSLGPLAGGLLGCIPQCGFSIMASDLYAGGVISLGTLLAVFLSTSDEALVIMLSSVGHAGDVLRLIGTKVVIGIAAGYVIYFIEKLISRHHPEKKKAIEDLCRDAHCGCHEEHGGIMKPAIHHTVQVFIFLFVFTYILDVLLAFTGIENLSRLMLADTVWQPVLAALIGLIPNCGASVVLTQLYLDSVISFGSVIAGLCSAAGLGLVMLYRMNRNRKENIAITLLLYGISVLAGILIQVLF